MRISETARVVLLFAFACGAIASISCSHGNEADTRCLPMDRFLIPQDYVGWIRVDFGAKDSAALPVEGDYLVFKIPTDGYLRTPAKYMCGWPQEYYYYSADKRSQLDPTKMIRWNGFPSGAEPQSGKVSDYIFIGSEAEFVTYGYSSRDVNGVPKYGRLISRP